MKSVVVCIVAALITFANGSSEPEQNYVKEMKIFWKLYEDCGNGNWNHCLKIKLASALDRVSKSYRTLALFDGVSFVNEQFVADNGPALSEEYLETTLQRSTEGREEALNELLLDKISRFLQSYTLNIKLTAIENLRNTVGEARGKGKKYGYYFLLIPIMMAGTALPLALGGLALLAGKALIISKLALLLAGIIGLKKLFSSHHDHHGGQRQFPSLSDMERSSQFEAAQSLAYRGHLQTSHET